MEGDAGLEGSDGDGAEGFGVRVGRGERGKVGRLEYWARGDGFRVASKTAIEG